MELTFDLIAASIAIPLLVAPAVALFLAVRLKRRRREFEQLKRQSEADLEKLRGELAETEQQKRAIEKRFSALIDIESEVAKSRSERETLELDIERLRGSYREKKLTHDRLVSQVAVYDEQLSFAELGVYEPHFDFGDSYEYKLKINAVREAQKAMIKKSNAVVCHTQWTVGDSVSKGETMVNRAIRLTLRAFNNECEAAIANVRWNNANAMINRIENAKKQIDKANESLNIEVTDDFVTLKLNELRLTHEYREKLKVERETRTDRARLEREEERLVKEAEEARKEEERYQVLLEKARAEAGLSSSEEQESRIRELERQLADAHEKRERAQAMAEKTKTGFVYIISNIGSFGKDVVKIGLTRRLDPTDRVRELGDASVPFLFDTHAMIYSDEAPALEAALHAEFDDRRINAANLRKEFFRATLEEVEGAVLRLAPEAEFHRDIEAQEFNETLAKRHEKLALEEARRALAFPEEI